MRIILIIFLLTQVCYANTFKNEAYEINSKTLPYEMYKLPRASGIKIFIGKKKNKKERKFEFKFRDLLI